MLGRCFAWWLSRMSELTPSFLVRTKNEIRIEVDPSLEVRWYLRRGGQWVPLSPADALTKGVGRRKGRRSVVVRPPVELVLTKSHTVPTVPLDQMQQVLRHELPRITPFATRDLFWHWTSRRRPSDRTRTDVTVTMVPKASLMPALRTLEQAGLSPCALEVGSEDRPTWLLADTAMEREIGWAPRLATLAGVLAAVALVLPFGAQEVALHQADTAIEQLRPAIIQIDALHRDISAGNDSRTVVAQEVARTGDLLETIAAITKILPDDTYLTDLSLRDRQVLLGGQSASAAHLIADLSRSPAIRNAAFAAPVTRAEGATADVFSIKAEIAR